MKPRWAVAIIILSTLCYRAASYIFNMDGYDTAAVPDRFYSFYCLFIALHLFLISVYAFALFLNVNNFKTKILLLWLTITEFSTFIDHVLRKYVLYKGFSDCQQYITFVVFLVCFVYISKQALLTMESDKFIPNKTYILNYYPEDFLGLINWIKNRTGHKAIYEGGYIYKFKRRTKRVEKIQSSFSLLHSDKVIFKEIPTIKEPDRFVGKRFNLFRYNCNHFVEDAQRAT